MPTVRIDEVSEEIVDSTPGPLDFAMASEHLANGFQGIPSFVDSQPVIAGDAEAWELVARALRLLRMREKTVVYQMYFLNSTVKEVGRNLGLKRHAAWRIHRTALHKLRRCVGCSNRL